MAVSGVSSVRRSRRLASVAVLGFALVLVALVPSRALAACGGAAVGAACPVGVGESDGNACTVGTCIGVFACECPCLVCLPLICEEVCVTLPGHCDESGANARPAPPGTACRAAAGVCDLAETCNGTSKSCPANAFRSAGTTCRSAVGTCDVAEVCTGSSATCPPDAKKSSSTVCRAAVGGCDAAETCSGTSNSCPPNALLPVGAVCRAKAGVCDVAEICSGTSAACPADALLPAGRKCRGAAGVCDVAELCSGTSKACPADALLPAGTTCRAAGGVCDVAETCTGSAATCPEDKFRGSTTTCRAKLGECDIAEKCSGASPSCPGDARRSAGSVCRAASGACDVAELCNGVSAVCPPDPGPPDADGDGVCDSIDNCVTTPNADQADADGDAVGDVCDEECGGNPCPQVDICHQAPTCDPLDGTCGPGPFTGCTLIPVRDAMLLTSNRNQNEGANDLLALHENGPRRIVLHFPTGNIDLSGMVEARLAMTIRFNDVNWPAAGAPVDAFRLDANFAEGNGKSFKIPADQAPTRGSGSGVTFNCAVDGNVSNEAADCANQWNAGATAIGAATSTVTITPSTAGVVEWVVTPDVAAGARRWLVRKRDQAGPGKVEFHSREGAATAGNPDLAPRLILRGP